VADGKESNNPRGLCDADDVFKRKANADFRQAILGRMSTPAIHRTPGAQHAGAATVTRSPSPVIQQ